MTYLHLTIIILFLIFNTLITVHGKEENGLLDKILSINTEKIKKVDMPSMSGEDTQRLWKEIFGDGPLDDIIGHPKSHKKEPTKKRSPNNREKPKMDIPSVIHLTGPQAESKIDSSVASTSSPNNINKNNFSKKSVKSIQ